MKCDGKYLTNRRTELLMKSVEFNSNFKWNKMLHRATFQALIRISESELMVGNIPK